MTKSQDGDRSKRPAADQLRELGVKGILLKMAEAGQIIELKCEMPQCYHPKGRRAFDPAGTAKKDWIPSPDHYPILKSKGGKLEPDNVRVAHVRCNQLDFAWRERTSRLLAKGKSLEEIAATLNKQKVRPVHGTNEWTAARVRKAYVS